MTMTLDENLLLSVARGEPEAQDAWYRVMWAPVYRLCFGFGAGAEAEELARDAMVHLLDRVPDRPAGRRWAPWATAVVVNFCRDRMRRRAVRVQRESPLDPGSLTSANRPSTLESRELARTLAEALGRLGDREREVFVLRDLEGQPTASVAEALGISESTVRSLSALARSRLRTFLRGRVPAAPETSHDRT